MVDLWWEEAARNDVLPLDNRPLVRDPRTRGRPSSPDRDRYVLLPARRAGARERSRSNVRNRVAHDHRRRSTSPDGVVAERRAARDGLGARRLRRFHLLDGRLRYVHNLYGKRARRRRLRRRSSRRARTRSRSRSRRPTRLRRARASCCVDGDVVGAGEIPHFTPMPFSNTGGGLTCGYEVGPAVGDDYDAPFRAQRRRSTGSSSTSRASPYRDPDGRVRGDHVGAMSACDESLRLVAAAASSRCVLARVARAGASRRRARRAHRRLRRRDARSQPDGTLAMHESITYDFGAVPHHGIFRDLVERETLRRAARSPLPASRRRARHRRRRGTPAQVQSTPGHVPAPAHRRSRPHDHRRAHATRSTTRVERRAADVPRPRRAVLGRDRQPVAGADRHARRSTVDAPAAITRVACFSGPQGSTLAVRPRGDATATSATFAQNDLGAGDGPHDRRRPADGHDPAAARSRSSRSAGTLADAFAVARRTRSCPRSCSRCSAIGVVVAARVAHAAATAATRVRRSTPRSATRPATRSRSALVRSGRGTGRVRAARRRAARPGRHARRRAREPARRHRDDRRPRGARLAHDHRARPEASTPPRLRARPRRQVAGKGTLLPYETELLNALFGDRPDGEALRSQVQVPRRASPKIQNAMYDDVGHAGLVPHPPRPDPPAIWLGIGDRRARRRRRRSRCSSRVDVVVRARAARGSCSARSRCSSSPSHMPSRTGKGSAMFSRVRGFRRLFDEGDEDLRAQFAEQHDIFSQYLPYAIVFGCTDEVGAARSTASTPSSSSTRLVPRQRAVQRGAARERRSTTSARSRPARCTRANRRRRARAAFGGGFSRRRCGGGGGGGELVDHVVRRDASDPSVARRAIRRRRRRVEVHRVDHAVHVQDVALLPRVRAASPSKPARLHAASARSARFVVVLLGDLAPVALAPVGVEAPLGHRATLAPGRGHSSTHVSLIARVRDRARSAARGRGSRCPG